MDGNVTRAEFDAVTRPTRDQAEARHKKPVGIYWLQAGAVRLAEAVTDLLRPRVPATR